MWRTINIIGPGAGDNRLGVKVNLKKGSCNCVHVKVILQHPILNIYCPVSNVLVLSFNGTLFPLNRE
tara:strand:+ start:26 stop:226 length:201 start_codon:yes stop_codon:yes gene_type:complete